MNLTFLQYNNYYNRILKREETVAAYGTKATNTRTFSDLNFNPNDGISTELIINWDRDWDPDYLICYDSSSYAIQSRWYVVLGQRTRANQYKVELRRDLLAEYEGEISNADIYLEKGKIRSISDPMIYNTEDLQVNQIKSKEILLKDNTKVAWLVGYLAPNTADKTFSIEEASVNYISTSSLSGWQYYQYITTPYKLISRKAIRVEAQGNKTGGAPLLRNMKFDLETGDLVDQTGIAPEQKPLKYTWDGVGNYDVLGPYLPDKFNACWSKLMQLVTGYHENDEISSLNGKFLKDEETGKIYSISVETGQSVHYDFTETELGFESAYATWANNYLVETISILEANTYSTNRNWYADCDYTPLTIILTEVSFNTLSGHISGEANKLQDAPYKMFCIPYGKVNVYNAKHDGTAVLAFNTVEETMALNIASCIARELGSSVYDVQLLPYCPLGVQHTVLPGIINVGDTETNPLMTEGKDYDLIGRTVAGIFIAKGIIFYPKISTFTFDINLNDSELAFPNNVLEAKKKLNCDLLRLCSPNYTSAFDFNVIKVGNARRYNIDCTYKPYSPYIHINPQFSRLYGKDYNDSRGLICQGDFSIPIINDAWIQYQINNKNYLNAFNRQIDTIEIQNSYQAMMDKWRAVSGTVSGTASGAGAGFQMGGGWGAAAGAVIGGVSSGAAGVADVKISSKLRKESLDMTVDQFNYSLQNIKALPQTLAKISSYDANNKIFPFIEYYTCTNEEKEAFENKMKFDGMTIMKITKIGNYRGGLNNPAYIKGKLIRCTGLSVDFHVLNEIANELDYGIYM